MNNSKSSGSARKRHARELFANLPCRYDRAGAVLGLGQDSRWRSKMASLINARPEQHVLDVATGTGLVACELVSRYGCTVVGLDQSSEMLAIAQARLERNPGIATHITFVSGEAEHLPFPDEHFDHLTFTYLLRYVDDPSAVLRELARVVRPGGRLAALEFGVPPSQPWRILWTIYTRLGLPTLGLLFSRQWSTTGRFLARNIPEFYARYPLEQIVAMWSQAGIGSVQTQRLSFGAGIVMSGTKSAG